MGANPNKYLEHTLGLCHRQGVGYTFFVEQTDLAYVAGVVDVHARMTIRELPTGGDYPVVQINWNHFPVLEHLGKLTGTKAIEVKRAYYKAGCSLHCAEKHQHIYSTSGRWVITGARATIFLWNIRPYLVFQQDLARQLIVAGTWANIKPATVQKMANLGWEIPEFALLSG